MKNAFYFTKKVTLILEIFALVLKFSNFPLAPIPRWSLLKLQERTTEDKSLRLRRQHISKLEFKNITCLKS